MQVVNLPIHRRFPDLAYRGAARKATRLCRKLSLQTRRVTWELPKVTRHFPQRPRLERKGTGHFSKRPSPLAKQLGLLSQKPRHTLEKPRHLSQKLRHLRQVTRHLAQRPRHLPRVTTLFCHETAHLGLHRREWPALPLGRSQHLLGRSQLYPRAWRSRLHPSPKHINTTNTQTS
jgi:hypothetical protein